jgi:hypothetical protein
MGRFRYSVFSSRRSALGSVTMTYAAAGHPGVALRLTGDDSRNRVLGECTNDAGETLAAQFGSYAINGDVVALTILVAKKLGQMNTRRFQRLRLEENTLTTAATRCKGYTAGQACPA